MWFCHQLVAGSWWLLANHRGAGDTEADASGLSGFCSLGEVPEPFLYIQGVGMYVRRLSTAEVATKPLASPVCAGPFESFVARHRDLSTVAQALKVPQDHARFHTASQQNDKSSNSGRAEIAATSGFPPSPSWAMRPETSFYV